MVYYGPLVYCAVTVICRGVVVDEANNGVLFFFSVVVCYRDSVLQVVCECLVFLD